jgi:Family of unknown function (DUF6544)
MERRRAAHTVAWMAQSHTDITAPAQQRDDDGLPALVRQYVDRVLPGGSGLARQIRVEQAGRIWSKPGGRAMRFTAIERFACDRVAFRWEARFPLVPLVSLLALKVDDGYSGGRGELTVRALGLPLQRHTGEQVALAEAYRYLAELMWAPDAILSNRELRWRSVGERHVEVAALLGGESVAVTFVFDCDGELERCYADARPRLVNAEAVRTRWGGAFSDYRTFAGRRMPSRAEAYWDLPEGRFVYWEAKLTGAEALEEPFGP